MHTFLAARTRLAWCAVWVVMLGVREVRAEDDEEMGIPAAPVAPAADPDKLGAKLEAKLEAPKEEEGAVEDEKNAISNIERDERYAGDTGREVGEVFLFIPRKVTEFLLWSSGVAIGVLERQPVVPRVQEAVTAAGGRLAVLPTAFAETGGTFNIGARMIVDFDTVATGLRVGFGGIHSFELEPRIAFTFETPLRSLLSLELLYKRDDDRLYLGVGQDPRNDPRNRFRPGQRGEEAGYFEDQTRLIVSYGLRLDRTFEFLLSGSIDRRETADEHVDEGPVLSNVFEPGSVVGAFETHWFSYVEGAGRLDTRPTRGRPSPGILAEAYIGSGKELLRDASASLIRVGGRLAGYIPLYRETNILSPRITIDGVVPLGSVPLPFTELAGEPDFRGFDTHRDELSLVSSLDYRWLIHDRIATSLFFDASVVAPSWDDIAFDPLRWVVGAAIDIHSADSELGRLAFAAGPEGAQLLFSIGLTTGYGDRQHRD